jgi:hypothetical protein
MTTLSRFGLILSGAYLLLAVYLIATQGLMGESFIAIILGLPWSLLLSFFEYGGASGLVLVILLIVPIAANAFLLYMLGKAISRKS